jgi:ABC-type sugar transport system ATPase subunit
LLAALISKRGIRGGKMSSDLQLVNLTKRYKHVEILKEISFYAKPGEFVVVVGPSGCGKSTLLRMVAGLEPVSHGNIKIANKTVTNKPAKKRNIAMVFQNYALYPHMTVRANLAYGLKMRKVPPQKIDTKVKEVAKVLKISHLLDRKPQAISGGQRQRVAMGRAMVREPALFLFDEPLSNLDANLRVEMRSEIKRMQQYLGITSLYVTHDQTEAMTLADKVIVLNQGSIAQAASPLTLYQTPNSKFVAAFMSQVGMNFISAIYDKETHSLKLSSGETLSLNQGGEQALSLHKKITLGVRAEHLMLSHEAHNAVKGKVRLIESLGSDLFVYLKMEDGTLLSSRLPVTTNCQLGDIMTLKPKMDNLHFFDSENGLRISF